MKHRKYIIEVLKNNEVIRKSDIVLAIDFYCVMESNEYKEIKKSLNNGEKINIRLVTKDEIMAL